MTQSNKKTSGLGLLFALCFVVAAAVVVQDYRFDRSIARDRDLALSVDREIADLQKTISDLRAAQTGYLATGQGPEFWMRRAAELIDRLTSGIDRLSAPRAAGDRYVAAASALADVARIDGRVRENIRQDQRFLASDLVFMEGLEATERLAGELDAARAAEMQAAESAIVAQSQLRFAMNTGALALLLIFGAAATRTASRVPPASPAATMAQMLRELPPPVKPPVPAIRPAAPAPAAPPSAVNLAEAADLCVDLARVIDDRDIPQLLERAAKVLDARGVIIWVTDHHRALLEPSLTHGYSEKTLARLAALETGADNITSLTFRSMRPQTMNGHRPAGGALAVPLITASGCTGVLAAELRDDKPAAESIAVAKIIAAQFATLIAPGEQPAASAAEA